MKCPKCINQIICCARGSISPYSSAEFEGRREFYSISTFAKVSQEKPRFKAMLVVAAHWNNDFSQRNVIRLSCCLSCRKPPKQCESRLLM